MDPLSIAASVAGLIGLIETLVLVSKPFASNILHAKESAQEFVDELVALQCILQKLQSFLTSQSASGSHFGDTSSLLTSSKALSAKLRVLRDKIEQASQRRIHRLAWPIDRKEYQESLNQIRAFSQLVQFALSLDTCALLSRTSDDIVETLSQQLQGLQLLSSVEDRLAPLEQAVIGQTVAFNDERQRQQHVGLLDWLSDTSQDVQHGRVKKNRVPGTGTWLLDHAQFTSWSSRASPSNVLWCYGEMGCGKTNLASLVIDQLSTDAVPGQNHLAYFYFSYSESEKQSASYLAGSILRHLLQDLKTPVPESLQKLQEKHSSAAATPVDDLTSVLLDVIRSSGRVYLVFDAVDESESSGHRKTFLKLVKLLRDIPNAYILMTSRPHLQDIQASLEGCPSIRIQASEDDLRQFIQTHIQYADGSDFIDSDFTSEISRKLVQSAQGLFLLPALQLKRVLQEPTRGDMEDALDDMPSDVVGILDDNLNRILAQPQSRKSLALNALIWLSQDKRVFSARELCDILTRDVYRDRLLDWKYRPHLRVIVECCQGLVYLDQSSSTLHLVHAAVQEYLKAHQVRIFGETTEKLAALSCFRYLLDPAFDSCQPSLPEMANRLTEEELEEVLESWSEADILEFLHQHAFFPYLSNYWGRHAKDCQSDETVRSLAIQLLSSSARVSRLDQIYHYARGYRGAYWHCQNAQSVHGLHLASGAGLTDIACYLMDTTMVDINQSTLLGSTPVIKAASCDEVEAVRELLRRGADPYRPNWYGNALHCAAEANAVRAILLLLDHGVDVDQRSPLDRTALECTLDRDGVEAADTLLQRGASISDYDSFVHKARLFDATKILQLVRRQWSRETIPEETGQVPEG